MHQNSTCVTHVKLKTRSISIKGGLQVSIPGLDHFQFADVKDAGTQIDRFVEEHLRLIAAEESSMLGENGAVNIVDAGQPSLKQPGTADDMDILAFPHVFAELAKASERRKDLV